MPPVATAPGAAKPPAQDWRTLFGILQKPVLSPIVIPATITPIGVVALFYFAAATQGTAGYQQAILLVLLRIMALNFLAMVLAEQILRILGLSVLQVIGWIMSALQAALAIQIILGVLRRLHVLM